MYKVSILARTLASWRTARRTGVCTIQAEGVRTFLYFKDGTLVFAEEGSSGETLGRMLVRQKRLTQDQYRDVIAKMTEAFVYNEQLRFGEVAVELGYLAEEEVSQALEEQVRWRAIRCLQRPVDEWTFEASEAQLEDIPLIAMSLESILYQAITWTDDEQRKELELDRVRALCPVAPPLEHRLLLNRYRLAPSAVKVLVRMSGDTTTDELISSMQDDDTDVEALLTAMHILGSCRFQPVATVKSEPVKSEPARVEPVRVEPAKSEPAKSELFEPRPPSRPAKIERTRTSNVLRRISQESAERRYTLEDGDLFRDPQSPQEARLLAETAFQRGTSHAAQERYAQARRAFERAVMLMPQRPEYKLHLAACRFVMQGSSAPPAELAEMEALCVESLRQDPNNAFAHYVLGRVAFLAGDLDTAQRRLSRAVKIDPNLTDAQRHLRLTSARLGARTQDKPASAVPKKGWLR